MPFQITSFPSCSIGSTPFKHPLGTLSYPQIYSAFHTPRITITKIHATPKDDNDDVDIDALAARLAAEAARLAAKGDQQSFSEEQIREDADTSIPWTPPTGFPPPPSDQSDSSSLNLPTSTPLEEASILSSVGEGGFYASDFELIQELGTLNIQQTQSIDFPILSSSDDPNVPLSFPSTSTTSTSARPAVVAYTASYFSGMPFQDPVVTLLKEYHPSARFVALNELRIATHLQGGLPDLADKWQAASSLISYNDPPIVPVLGYFMAGTSERLLRGGSDESSQSDKESEEQETIWVVSKWEGCAPLALYPSTQQTSGLGLGSLFGSNKRAQKERSKMLKAIARGMLRSLGFCHDRGVIHGSIGAGSFLLSTFDDSDSTRLIVKIDNFGFGRLVNGTNSDGSLSLNDIDSPLALAIQGDKRQLVIVFLEYILSALTIAPQGDNNPSSSVNSPTSAEAVTRVLGDVYQWNWSEFRQYVSAEPDWEGAAEFLDADDGAGWDLVRELLEGREALSVLAQEHPFVAEA